MIFIFSVLIIFTNFCPNCNIFGSIASPLNQSLFLTCKSYQCHLRILKRLRSYRDPLTKLKDTIGLVRASYSFSSGSRKAWWPKGSRSKWVEIMWKFDSGRRAGCFRWVGKSIKGCLCMYRANFCRWFKNFVRCIRKEWLKKLVEPGPA